MKSQKLGKNISEVEILNVSPHGIWISIQEKEYFMDYEHFPWFKEATLSDVFNMEFHHQHHLYWPILDVDLELDSIESPEKNPLTARRQL